MPPKPKTFCVSFKRSNVLGKASRPRSPSPAGSVQSEAASEAASEVPEMETGRREETDDRLVVAHNTKRAKVANKVVTNLTDEEEESMVEWLKVNPILYNKKQKSYKEIAQKDLLWAEKATEMGKTAVILKTWYTSLRSRYGRLLKKKKAGDEVTGAEMSERDLWVVGRFEFLRPHIYEVRVQKKPNMRRKLDAAFAACTVPGMAVEKDDNDPSRPSTSNTTSSIISSSLGCRQKHISAKSEGALSAGLDQQIQQMTAHQRQQVMDRLKPCANREREAFVDWTRSVILDLDHTIWRRCQHDISQIMYKYIGENDQLNLKQQAALSTSVAPTTVQTAQCLSD